MRGRATAQRTRIVHGRVAATLRHLAHEHFPYAPPPRLFDQLQPQRRFLHLGRDAHLQRARPVGLAGRAVLEIRHADGHSGVGVDRSPAGCRARSWSMHWGSACRTTSACWPARVACDVKSGEPATSICRRSRRVPRGTAASSRSTRCRAVPPAARHSARDVDPSPGFDSGPSRSRAGGVGPPSSRPREKRWTPALVRAIFAFYGLEAKKTPEHVEVVAGGIRCRGRGTGGPLVCRMACGWTFPPKSATMWHGRCSTTHIRKVTTCQYGVLQAREIVRVAATPEGRCVARSRDLTQLVPPGCRYAYDLIVEVGLARR